MIPTVKEKELNRKAEDLTKHIWKKIEECFEIEDTIWLSDTETLFDAIWYEIEGIYKEHNKEIRNISAEFRRNDKIHEEFKDNLRKENRELKEKLFLENLNWKEKTQSN